jgi:DNA-binding response OmpR family regulator
MNYKIVSNNQNLIEKSSHIFHSLGFKQSVHIQEVDLWLIDTKDITKDSLLSYKNKSTYSHILFITNHPNDTQILLGNSLTNYISIEFLESELKNWCKYFISEEKNDTLELSSTIKIDLKKQLLLKNQKEFPLSKKELLLLKELSSFKYIQTKTLQNNLNLTSLASVRSIINRLRKKLGFEIFEQNKSLGYKLINTKIKSKQNSDISYIKELEDQNTLMQNIVDSSPIFIVTFIHRQLYCINKSFRDYLGNDIIKELWDEESGDFFKLIKHDSKDIENLKKNLFTKGKHNIKLYEVNSNKTDFEIETFYFENLDKHLFVFKEV